LLDNNIDIWVERRFLNCALKSDKSSFILCCYSQEMNRLQDRYMYCDSSVHVFAFKKPGALYLAALNLKLEAPNE
jgi:hypothetical protein